MNLLDIKKVDLQRKAKKRIGRGCGSGTGCTAGKGMKGQNCRSGVTLPVVFEGGTMPLYRRIPKRGFNNARFQKNWVSITIDKLSIFKENEEVTIEEIFNRGIIKGNKSKKYVWKLIGDEKIEVKGLTVKVHSISKSAREIIEKNGGKVEILKVPKWKRKKSRRKV